ncbi:MAG: helix-turn-helix domain-containing protein [Planctomycetales bacterium]|nr:helix-turn-helix domain-containing protein [Planctomycetales bacterium]
MTESSDPTSILAQREYFSTSEVAELCRVHKNTIIAAINRGIIPASKTPGGHNRVSKADLLSYMRERGIPSPVGVPPAVRRILVVGEDPATVRRLHKALPPPQFEILSVRNLYEAGASAARVRPEIIVMPADPGEGRWDEASAQVRRLPETSRARVLGLSESGQAVAGGQFDAVLPRNARPTDFLDAVTRLAP